MLDANQLLASFARSLLQLLRETEQILLEFFLGVLYSPGTIIDTINMAI